jgi:hypothetical protein
MRCQPRSTDLVSDLMLMRMPIAQVVTSYVAIGLLCFATVYGPLMHEHPAGELGVNAVVHAHLPEPEEPMPASGEPSIGFHHSHGNAIWLDALTTTAPAQTPELIATVTISFVIPHPQQTQMDDASMQMPRAHSPPELDSRIPRSPPA